MNNFELGDLVLVPEPENDDIHTHNFIGTVQSIENGVATVEDEDGDCFDIEVDRLEMYEA